MIINVKITPKTYALAFRVTEVLDSLAFLTKERAFRAITGKTHGIRFNMSPPTKAKIRAVNKLMLEELSDIFI